MPVLSSNYFLSPRPYQSHGTQAVTKVSLHVRQRTLLTMGSH